MSSKDYLRKRDYYLPFFEFLVRDYPKAPLYRVVVCMNDGSSRQYFTFSQSVNYSDFSSLLITKVTLSKFDSLKLQFCNFLKSLSKIQMSSLMNYYRTVLVLDECSPSMISFNSLLSSLESNK